jgi:hypothetical protein
MTNKARPSVTIKGNVNAANVNFGEQEFHGAVTFTFNGAPSASEDVAAQLKTLYQQLADALAQVPAEQARDVKEVHMAAEDALAETEKEQPDKERLQIRGDKLIAAAKNLAAVAPIAVQIAKTLLLIG